MSETIKITVARVNEILPHSGTKMQVSFEVDSLKHLASELPQLTYYFAGGLVDPEDLVESM